MPEIPREIVDHYSAADENARLRTGLGQLEFLRTQEIVRRFLPDGAVRIADVGGATGIHAEWLADDGHQVQIYDVVPEHVAAAQEVFQETPGISAAWGDARELPCPDDTFDAALVLGPLYHLTERQDRIVALREAGRVVRSGGLVFVAAISRFASLFDSLEKSFLFEPEGARMVEQDLATGQHRNPTDRPGWFTTAYFHRPEELRQECLDASLTPRTVLGVEGIAGWLPHLRERWESPAEREVILWSAAVVEEEESVLGVSAHLVAVCQVP